MVAGVMLTDGMRNEQLEQQAVGQTTTTTVMTSRRNEVSRFHRHRLAGQTVSRKYQRAAIRRAEYRRLKAIVPSVADKKSVSKLTVIEEAIRYIDNLHEMLDRKLGHNQTHSHQDVSSDTSHLFPVCCQPDQSFLCRLLFPVPAITGSDVTPTPPTNHSHRPTVQSSPSRVSTVIRF